MNLATFTWREPTAPEVPLLVSIPHTGTFVPADIETRFADASVKAVPDTDWHLHRLYDFVPALGAWTLVPTCSRYVVDLNRPPDGAALYPGRSETQLVPTTTFSNQPIYLPGSEPDAAEIQTRRARYWAPYHAALQARLEDLKARFGFALLFDAHSIISDVPRFSASQLPGLMLGDADGTSAAKELGDAVYAVHQASEYTHQRNHPFKGGYITRHYGQPAHHVHALQLEMSQRLYMDEGPPFAWNGGKAARLAPTLRATLNAFIQAGKNLYGR
jgi:N-formylglutamate deformylase